MSDKTQKEFVDEMNHALLLTLDPANDYSYEQFLAEYVEQKTDSSELNLKLNLTFVNESTNQDPKYATNGSSGFDFRANITSANPNSVQGGLGPVLVIGKGEVMVVPTGLYFEIPDNFEIQVRPRSGLAAKHGITVLNTPGTIDADYRGEIKIILINHGKEAYTIEHGDRIAQGVIASVTAKQYINLERVDSINKNTERNIGGFGSTGTN
jgi:dUTP pyrophosphatase